MTSSQSATCAVNGLKMTKGKVVYDEEADSSIDRGFCCAASCLA